MSYEELLVQLEDALQAIVTERRLAHAGLKTPELSTVHARLAGLFTQERIHELKDALAHAHPKERERMERTLFALLEGNVATHTAPLDQEITARRLALGVTVGGLRVGYLEFPELISREPDFDTRESLWKTYVGLVSELTPKLQEREQVSRQAMIAFGFLSVREYAETKKRLKYELLLKKSLPILEETTGLYRRVMTDAVRKSYDRELGEISAAHLLHWRTGREFDHLFPTGNLLANVRTALGTIGFDLEHLSQLQTDIEDRPRKRPRAACFGVRVPEEVHLVLKPKGGYDDIRTFMHEAGHALHLAHTDPALPFEQRRLSRSIALSETFSFLLERLAGHPLWLEHVLKVPKGAAERISGWTLLGELFRLRRAIAKFSYELAFDEHPFDAARNKSLYAKTLRDLTGFEYEEALWMEDRDPLFRCADELRAWIAAAQLEEHLTRAFGDRWFLKRETGAFLRTLFAKGASWETEELIQSLGMQPWDPLPLIRSFDPVAKLLR